MQWHGVKVAVGVGAVTHAALVPVDESDSYPVLTPNAPQMLDSNG